MVRSGLRQPCRAHSSNNVRKASQSTRKVNQDMPYEALSPPPIDSECPNIREAAILEFAAGQLNAATAYGFSRGDDVIGHLRSEAARATLSDGSVVTTITRLALQKVCESCPGPTDTGDCPRQEVAERISTMVLDHFAGGPIIISKSTINVPETRLPKSITFTTD